MDKKKGGKKSGAKMVLPGWFASYADMVTVLMVFFILLFTMSNVDEERFMALIDGFAGERHGRGAGDSVFAEPSPFEYDQPPVQTEEPPLPPDIRGYTPPLIPPEPTHAQIAAEMANAFRTYLAPYYQVPGSVVPPGAEYPNNGVEIIHAHDYSYLRLIMNHHAYFLSGQSALQPAAIAVIDAIAETLIDHIERGHRIVIEGHADNIPMSPGGRYFDNWDLTAARANAVFRHLVYNWGANPFMIQPMGMGDLHPFDTNETPEGRANNRRVEIRIYTEVRPETTTRPTAPGVSPGFTIPGL